MRIIEEVGFEVHSQNALELFRKYGANVDTERKRVSLKASQAMELIQMAPSEVTLCGQDEKNDCTLGGTRVYTGTGGTALYIYDPATEEKRQATLDDLKRIARLVDGLDNIHILLLPTYPNDIASDRVDVNRFYAGLSNTSKHIMGGVYTPEGTKKVIEMAEIIAGSPEALRRRPIISIITCVISPLKLDQHYADLMIPIAQSGIPVICPSEPLCGATSPITIAGNVTIQTVDSLIGVMLTQIANPGTPVIFGSVATNTDLTSLKYLAGSVEMGLTNAASAQMAQFYKLPFYATGGMSDSKAVDAQSGYESAISGLMCALAGSNFIHDSAGLMEFAMTVCPEKYVIDNEIMGMAMRAVQGITVNDETLAFDLIKELGPGGNFVAAKHTRRHMRQEHYQPTVSNRQSREDWQADGSLNTWQRASKIVQDILDCHSWAIPEDVKAGIIEKIPEVID